jgi:hypothetical protein
MIYELTLNFSSILTGVYHKKSDLQIDFNFQFNFDWNVSSVRGHRKDQRVGHQDVNRQNQTIGRTLPSTQRPL